MFFRLVISLFSLAVSAQPIHVSAETFMGETDDLVTYGQGVQLKFERTNKWRLQFDGRLSDLSGLLLSEVGAAIFYRENQWLVGTRLAAKRLSDLSSQSAEIQIQRFIDDRLTVAAFARYETFDLGEGSLEMGLQFRTYFLDSLMFETGIASSERHPKVSDLSLIAKVEWQPKILKKLNLSLFAEEWVSETYLVGVRFRNSKGSLRKQHESGPVRLVR